MEKSLKNFTTISLIASLGFIIFGATIYALPQITIVAISYMFGILLIALGVAEIISYFITNKKKMVYNYDLVYGMVNALIGMVLLLNPQAIPNLLTILLGIWILLTSLIKIQFASMLKEVESKEWIITVVISIITSIFGILLMFNPVEGAEALVKAFGLLSILYATLDLIQTIIYRSKIPEMVEDIVIKKKTK